MVKDLTCTESRPNDRYIKPEYFYLLRRRAVEEEEADGTRTPISAGIDSTTVEAKVCCCYADILDQREREDHCDLESEGAIRDCRERTHISLQG